jgi:hypothetical protein
MILYLSWVSFSWAQKPSLSGTLGISYEGYGLNLKPGYGSFYTPRKPWHLVRFNVAPVFNFGAFSVPVNFNFTPMQTNFATPPTSWGGLGGFGSVGGKPQNFWQFLTNPLNSFGINPKYKWAEAQLGTQYLKYSELSTGDIGVFGYGFSLSPGKFRIKFFNGVSQRPVDYNSSAVPVIIGAYQRNNWMAQVGMAKEGEYEVAFNLAKGKDKRSSVSPAPPPSVSPPPGGVDPQEGLTASVVLKSKLGKSYYVSSEFAHSIYTKDENAVLTSTGVKAILPFIESRTSTVADNAATVAFGRKSKNFDVGISTKYIGAGFQTAGYPWMQGDRLDYTLNTRFNIWKNKDGIHRMNVTGSIGQRINNRSNTTTKAKQIIASVNWYTQFSDRFNVNVSYNNFGFQTAGPTGLRNVANDLSISPTYHWSNEKMMHLLTLTYSWSKYDERNPFFAFNTTSNNTNTVLLNYIPTWFQKSVTADFGLMYFHNNTPLTGGPPNQIITQLMSATANAGIPYAKKKARLKGQLQYTLNKTDSQNPAHNLLATTGTDYNLTKKLTWGISMTANLFQFGQPMVFNPPYIKNPQYLESMVRTSLNYRF